MYDIKYNTNNIIHPKVNIIEQWGILIIWDSYMTRVLLRRYTFNEFLNLFNVALRFIFYTKCVPNFCTDRGESLRFM